MHGIIAISAFTFALIVQTDDPVVKDFVLHGAMIYGGIYAVLSFVLFAIRAVMDD